MSNKKTTLKQYLSVFDVVIPTKYFNYNSKNLFSVHTSKLHVVSHVQRIILDHNLSLKVVFLFHLCKGNEFLLKTLFFNHYNFCNMTSYSLDISNYAFCLSLKYQRLQRCRDYELNSFICVLFQN